MYVSVYCRLLPSNMSVRSTSGSSCTTYGTRVQLYTYSTFKVTSVLPYILRTVVRVRVCTCTCACTCSSCTVYLRRYLLRFRTGTFEGTVHVLYNVRVQAVHVHVQFFLLYVRVQCTRVHVHVVVRPRTKPSGRKRKSAVLKFSRSTLGLHVHVYTERKKLGWDGTRFLNLYALAAHFFCFFQRVQRVPSSKRCKTAFFSLKVKPRPFKRHFC